MKVQMKHYIMLKITFGVGDQDKLIKVWYVVIDIPYYYNMITHRPNFNQLGVSLYILYSCMKYLPSN